MRALIHGSWLVITAFAVLLAGCESSQSQDKRFTQPVTQRPTTTGKPLAPNEIVDPAVPEAEPDIMPQTHLAAGRLHESQGRLDRAVEQYRLAVQAKPDWVEALNRLGIALDRIGRYSEADEVFQRAIARAPDQSYLYNNLGFSLMSQFKWAEAEVELRKALERQPGFARAHVNLAMTLAQQERFDEALVQFQAALRPEDAHYNMGLMYQSKRRLADAARSFKTALDINPRMAAAKKRLEGMPTGISQDVNRQAQATASPKFEVPLIEPASVKTLRPITPVALAAQPAASTQPAAVASPGSTTRPAVEASSNSGVSSAAKPVSATQPAVEGLASQANNQEPISPADADPICFDLPVDEQAVTSSDFETRCEMLEFTNILDNPEVTEASKVAH